MDNQIPEPQNQSTIPSMPQAPQPESKIGPIIGIIIVIIVLVVGALYFWGEKLNQQKIETVSEQNSAPATPAEDNAVAELKAQSTSDDVSSIKQDLTATTIEGLDASFQAEAQ